MKQPIVCIVIVNWNGGEKIKQCLSSLKLTNYKNYKVILVDNGSNAGSVEELLKINSKMDVIRLPKNFGYTIATNLGWRYSIKKYKADYICAMDSDIITVQKDWLSLEIKELEKKKEYGISCGKLVFPDGRLQLLFYERAHTWMSDNKDKGQYDFVKEVSAVGGACIIIKSSVIKKIGYYDENFFYGPNDLDYCFRAGKQGFKVLYNGLAKSIHNGSSSYLASDQTKIFGAQSLGNILFTTRHFGLFQGIKMSLRQFVRVFLTRKNPYSPISYHNTNLHKDLLKRLLILVKSSYVALTTYKKVKNGNYEKYIIK